MALLLNLLLVAYVSLCGGAVNPWEYEKYLHEFEDRLETEIDIRYI